jgi:hypothetical protein
MFGLGHGDGVFRFVDPEFGLHAGFFVEDLADRGRLIAAMFLIGQCLESPVEDKRKRDRNSDGFLVSHGARPCHTPYRTARKFRVDMVYDTIIHMIHAQNEAASRQRARNIPAGARNSPTPAGQGPARSNQRLRVDPQGADSRDDRGIPARRLTRRPRAEAPPGGIVLTFMCVCFGVADTGDGTDEGSPQSAALRRLGCRVFRRGGRSVEPSPSRPMTTRLGNRTGIGLERGVTALIGEQ